MVIQGLSNVWCIKSEDEGFNKLLRCKKEMERIF